MADNIFTGWIIIDDTHYQDVKTGEIYEIVRDSLKLDRINENGTIREMINNINANFLNIAKHGGGPAGIDGADGANGVDGANVEYIYVLCDEMNPDVQYPTDADKIANIFNSVKSAGSYTYKEGGVTVTWFDNAQPISPEQKNEYVWSRIKRGTGLTEWYYASEPVLWSHWGETGKDGDGVEYIFFIQSTENFSDSEEEWNNRWSFLSSPDTSDDILIKKAVYSMDDFYPNASWFNQDLTKNNVREILKNKYNKTFTDDDWNTAWTGVSASFNWDWRDNPGDVTPSLKYQYVSIRKTKNNPEDSKGKDWGAFSYPKLWSKYAIIKFKSIAFAATTFDTDLRGCTVSGGDFSNPIPNLTKNGDQIIEVTWTDSPEPVVSAGKTQIWMTSTNVTEGDESDLVWSAPQKMTDTADLQVEWSSTDKTLAELVSINQSLKKYNFSTFLKANYYDENAAELAWRTAMSDDFGISFGDNSENAILMATCQLKNGVWTDWKITRVKGEKGDAGTSVNIKDRIIYESYLTSGTEYNYENANNRRDTHTPDKTPENGDLLIVYPAEPNENGIYYGDASDGGKLYMWKYTNNWEDYNDPNSIGEETGNTYVSPNSHLILWDGDSWGDVGNIVGPEGKSYTIAVKYAKDGKNGEKEEIKSDSEIPNAKWIGTCVYEEGTTPPDIKDTSWKWSLFKGQDGYGYEYIFIATSTKDSASIPQVPQMPSGGNWHTTPNIVPEGWTDDPIEPTETNRYIWMCWRKFDHSTQKWTDFMGVKDTTNAKLWLFYVTDGKPGEPGTPGEAGNGYQYKYIRYDNSVNYGSTTCTVTNPSSDEPIFKIGEEIVSSTNSAQGVDSGHTYEYRSERYGHDGNWSPWSNPVIIARYLDDSDIQATVQREVQTATESIQNSLNDANTRISTLSGKFDENGNLNVPLSDGIASGYLKTDENGNLILSTAGVTTAPDGVTTFADYINHETKQFTTITNDINALEGTITTSVTNVADERITTGFNKIQSDINGEFATMRNTVAKGSYVTDIEGYLLVENTDGSRERAKDNNGNPTQNYTDVRDSDKDKLIYVNSELASISQSVSDGIAATSIITSTENGSASLFQQVDESGSKIFMNADLIDIQSKYFNLNSSGLEMTGNLLAKDKNGIITAGVIGDDTADNDVKFFAGPKPILSPITKQKLICVKDIINENRSSQIFVRYPNLDKKSTGQNLKYEGKDTCSPELWDYGTYDYNPGNGFVYSGTFDTYYMWKCVGDNTLAILTEERDYSNNNLSYHRDDFSLTPKIVAFLKNDVEYTTGENANLTYIVNAEQDVIYIDQFYDAYAWVLDSNSEGVSLYDYHNSSEESLNTKLVIYTESENVNIGDILGTQRYESIGLPYKVIDVSVNGDITQSSFRVYEDGSIYANQGYIGTAKITTSGIGVTSDDGFVLIGGNGIKIKDKYDNYSIISPSEITLSAALRKRNAYIFDSWDWDNNGDSKVVQLKKDYNIYPSSEINSAFKECDVINTFNQGDTFTIPSSNSLIGRQITLIGGSALCSMVIKAVEEAGLGYIIHMGNEADKFQFSDGCKFYENGGTSSSLTLSNEGVDMIGVGFGNNFKGFVITNRFDINSNYNYGTKFKCLGMFSINKINNNFTIESYTFNGQKGTISSSSTNYVTIKTPFKINNMSEILVNISGESGDTTGITYNYSLSTDSNYILSITVYSSNISKKFKLTVFNFGDFVSLINDSSEPPAITKKEYSYNSSTWYNLGSTLYFDYGINTCNIRLTVNSAVKKVEYSLQSGSSYFTFTDGSIETPGNTTVPIGKVSTKKNNNTSSYFKGIIKITLHTSTDGTNDKTSIITIPLEQDYYTQPSYGGGS